MILELKYLAISIPALKKIKGKIELDWVLKARSKILKDRSKWINWILDLIYKLDSYKIFW